MSNISIFKPVSTAPRLIIGQYTYAFSEHIKYTRSERTGKLDVDFWLFLYNLMWLFLRLRSLVDYQRTPQKDTFFGTKERADYKINS